MAQITETGTLDLKAHKAGHDDAAKTATNYLTEVSGNRGVIVHKRGNLVTYSQLVDDGMNVVAGGANTAHFGEQTRIGRAAANHLAMDKNGYRFNQADKNVFSVELYGDPTATIGTIYKRVTIPAQQAATVGWTEGAGYIESSGYVWMAYTTDGGATYRQPMGSEVYIVGPGDMTAYITDADGNYIAIAHSMTVANRLDTPVEILVADIVDTRSVRTRIGSEGDANTTITESGLTFTDQRGLAGFHVDTSSDLIRKNGVEAYMLYDVFGVSNIWVGRWERGTSGVYRTKEEADYAYTPRNDVFNVPVASIPNGGAFTVSYGFNLVGHTDSGTISFIGGTAQTASISYNSTTYATLAYDGSKSITLTAVESIDEPNQWRVHVSGILADVLFYGSSYTFGSRLDGYDVGGFSSVSGLNNVASGLAAHAQNQGTIAASDNQTALGRFNVEDSSDAYALIVGNGTSDSNRSNAFTVDWQGNVEAAGRFIGPMGYGSYYNNATLTLATSAQKIALADFSGSGTSASGNGIKVAKAGVYLVNGSAYLFTGFTENDVIHLIIVKNGTWVCDSITRVYTANPYQSMRASVIVTCAENDVLYLYAYNQNGARGSIAARNGHGLSAVRLA